jgi:hypothetical protein
VLNRANGKLRMAQEIEEAVRALESRDSLKSHPFQMAHVSYYCKHSSGRYLGCEIALVEFSFVDGIRKTYHAYINPGEIPIGYSFLAMERAPETHLFPLLPDGFGSKSAYPEILNNNIRLFLMGEELPPLYRRPGDIDAVESVLWQLNAGRDSFHV